ncbi:MAG: hypothetical protein R6U44_00635 [Archaeoglobaceae archaeon]
MFNEGDTKCVEALLKPAKKVLKMGKEIEYDPYEKRVGLWNEVKENYDKYMDGECGEFLKDLDNHFRSQFETAMLVLAAGFKDNGDEFKPAERFNDKEIEAYERIERYNVFEILSIDDIKKRIISEDNELIKLFKDYYVYMDKWVDETLNNPKIKLPVRFYLKNRWNNYKNNINEAVSNLIMELDWFRKLISQWESEAQHLAEEEVEKFKEDIRGEVTAEVEEAVKEERDKIQEESQKIEERESEITEEEVHLKAKEDDLKTQEEEIKKVMEELRGVKEKVEKGSRKVDIEEAKQYEMNFIGRIERKLGEKVNLFNKTFEVATSESSEIDVSRYIGTQTKFGELTEREAKNLPCNRYIEANLVEKKLVGGKRNYTLRAVFTSNVDAYAQYRIDTDPLELRDVNIYMSEAKDEAKQNEKTIILCLASPTGFTDAVKERVNSEDFHRNFLSKYLSVCLLDLETGELIYNPYDELARESSYICEIEIDEEKKAKVENCVIDMMKGLDWITLRDASSCGDESIVKAVFYMLAEKKGWEVKFIETVGLVLMRNAK